MHSVLRLPTTLLALSILQTASASYFADLNSLRAFTPAVSPDELVILSVDQTPQNLTSLSLQRLDPDSKSPNPAYSLASSVSDSKEHRRPSEDQLNKRAGACGSYNSCSTLGAPSLCCPPSRVCSADSSGHVGCCPDGAACTGTIPGAGGVIATSTSVEGYTSSGYALTTTTTPATSNNGGFIIAGSSTVAVLGSQGRRLSLKGSSELMGTAVVLIMGWLLS